MKADEESCTDANHFTCLFWEVVCHDPSVEKICDRFAFPTLENYVDQPSVLFGVSERERDAGVWFWWIEVTKTKF